MAVSLVGYASQCVSFGVSAWTFNFAGNMSGISTPAAGDLVVVFYAISATTSLTLTVKDQSSVAYNYATGGRYTDSTSADINLRVAWKIMTATPDTGLILSASGLSGRGNGVSVLVLRGHHPTTPIWWIAENAGGTGANPTPPSLDTSASAGSLIVIGGAGAAASITGPYTSPPGGMTSFFSSYYPTTTDIAVGAGLATSLTYTGSTWSGNSSSSLNASVAVTLGILRGPEASTVSITNAVTSSNSAGSVFTIGAAHTSSATLAETLGVTLPVAFISSGLEAGSLGATEGSTTTTYKASDEPATLSGLDGAEKGYTSEHYQGREGSPNHINDSFNFSGVMWPKVGADVVATSSTEMAPNGDRKAHILYTRLWGYPRLGCTHRALGLNTQYTFSIYAKWLAGMPNLIVRIRFGTANYDSYYDIKDGATPAYGQMSLTGDGWYRITVPLPTGASGTPGIQYLFFGSTFSTSVDTYVSLWGAQLEVGYEATTPIETYWGYTYYFYSLVAGASPTGGVVSSADTSETWTALSSSDGVADSGTRAMLEYATMTALESASNSANSESAGSGSLEVLADSINGALVETLESVTPLEVVQAMGYFVQALTAAAPLSDSLVALLDGFAVTLEEMTALSPSDAGPTPADPLIQTEPVSAAATLSVLAAMAGTASESAPAGSALMVSTVGVASDTSTASASTGVVALIQALVTTFESAAFDAVAAGSNAVDAASTNPSIAASVVDGLRALYADSPQGVSSTTAQYIFDFFKKSGFTAWAPPSTIGAYVYAAAKLVAVVRAGNSTNNPYPGHTATVPVGAMYVDVLAYDKVAAIAELSAPAMTQTSLKSVVVPMSSTSVVVAAEPNTAGVPASVKTALFIPGAKTTVVLLTSKQVTVPPQTLGTTL